MAFVLYGAVATLGSSRVLARALTDKVVLPRDTPHEVKPETVMDEMAKNILQKAPKGANCKNSTALADNSLVAHLWNTHDTCYLLIVTPAIDNAIVQQLWLVMEREYVSLCGVDGSCWRGCDNSGSNCDCCRAAAAAATTTTTTTTTTFVCSDDPMPSAAMHCL